jgi:hypothetical protein
MLDEVEQLGGTRQGFKTGITLNEYLSYMETYEGGDDASPEKEEDLYVTSKRREELLQRDVRTFEIRETDEDNYEESTDDIVRGSWGGPPIQKETICKNHLMSSNFSVLPQL